MHPPKSKGEIVFETPWFQILSQQLPGSAEPHYSIQSPNFVVIVALNPQGHLLLVRQFRPSIGAVTLELPAGHIEAGESPEEAARKELCEETGHEADTFELLATLSPSNARFTNRMLVFFAPNVRLASHPAYLREAGVDFTFYGGDLRSLLDEKDFFAGGSCAALFAAIARGKLTI
jgi:ADP-ribose pyrophosphatase